MKALKVFIKHFETPQRSVKIKIQLNFFSLSEIGTGRVKIDQTVVVFIPNLLYFVFIPNQCTLLLLSHQYSSLFPSSAATLFTTRRRSKLQMCVPLQTKYGVFTFYSPSFVAIPSLFNFQLFFQTPYSQNSPSFYSGLESNQPIVRFFFNFMPVVMTTCKLWPSLSRH